MGQGRCLLFISMLQARYRCCASPYGMTLRLNITFITSSKLRFIEQHSAHDDGITNDILASLKINWVFPSMQNYNFIEYRIIWLHQKNTKIYTTKRLHKPKKNTTQTVACLTRHNTPQHLLAVNYSKETEKNMWFPDIGFLYKASVITQLQLDKATPLHSMAL